MRAYKKPILAVIFVALLASPVMLRHYRRQCVPATLGVVEVAVRVGLQSHGELMKVFRYLVVVIKTLVEVRFIVAVEIVETHDLIATTYINVPVAEFEPKRLKQPTRDSFPGAFAGRRIDA